MPSLKDIRKRIASVKNTQKITRALKLVSAAKLKRAQDAMNQLKPYAQTYRTLLGNLVSQLGGDAPHPLLERREDVKNVGVLALSSDRGMCGGFNAGLQKRVLAYSEERGGARIYPLGRRISGYTAKGDFEIGEAFGMIVPPSDETMRHITQTLTAAFLSGELDEVVIISNRFESALSQVPTVLPLLPVVAEEGEGEGAEGADVLYEPDQTLLLAHVLPRYVEVQVREAVLESIAGEHAARMNAMNNATDNATDMIASLTLQRNRARQAAITTELMEIIGGSEALK